MIAYGKRRQQRTFLCYGISRKTLRQNICHAHRERKERRGFNNSFNLDSSSCGFKITSPLRNHTCCSSIRNRLCSGRVHRRRRNHTLINYFTFKKLRSIMMDMELLSIHKNEVYEGSFSPSSQNYLSGVVSVITSFISTRRKICQK